MASDSCHFHDSMLLELLKVVQCLRDDVTMIDQQINIYFPVVPPPGICTPSFHSTPGFTTSVSATPDFTTEQPARFDVQPVSTTLQMEIVNNNITQLQSLLTFISSKLNKIGNQTSTPYQQSSNSITMTPGNHLQQLGTSFTQNSHPAIVSCSCTCPPVASRSMYWFCNSVCGRLTHIQNQCQTLREDLSSAITNEEIRLVSQLSVMQQSKTVINAKFDHVSSLGKQGITICSNLQIVNQGKSNYHVYTTKGQQFSRSSKPADRSHYQTEHHKPKKNLKKSASAFFRKLLPKVRTNAVSPVIQPVNISQNTSNQFSSSSYLDTALSIISSQTDCSVLSSGLEETSSIMSSPHTSPISLQQPYDRTSLQSLETDNILPSPSATEDNQTSARSSCTTKAENQSSISTETQLHIPHNTETPDQGDNTETPDQGDNTEAADQGDNTEAADQGDNTETPDQGDNTESSDQGNNTESSDQGDNTQTSDQGDNPETPDQGDNTEFHYVAPTCPDISTPDGIQKKDRPTADKSVNPVIMAFRLPFYTDNEDFVASELSMSPTPVQSVKALISNIESRFLSETTSTSIQQCLTKPSSCVQIAGSSTLTTSPSAPRLTDSMLSNQRGTLPCSSASRSTSVLTESIAEPSLPPVTDTMDNLFCSESLLSSPETVESLLHTSILDESEMTQLQDILQDSFVCMTSLSCDEQSNEQKENELLTVLNQTMNISVNVGSLNDDLLGNEILTDDIYNMSTVLYETSACNSSSVLIADQTSLVSNHAKQEDSDISSPKQSYQPVLSSTVTTSPVSYSQANHAISTAITSQLEKDSISPASPVVLQSNKMAVRPYQTRQSVRKRLFTAISTSDSFEGMTPLSDQPSACKFKRSCFGCDNSVSDNRVSSTSSPSKLPSRNSSTADSSPCSPSVFASFISDEFKDRRITNSYPAKNSLQRLQKFMQLQPVLLQGAVRDDKLISLLKQADDIQYEYPLIQKINILTCLNNGDETSPHLFARDLVYELFNLSDLSKCLQKTSISIDCLDQDVITAIKTATYEKFFVTDPVWKKKCVPQIQRSLRDLFQRKLKQPVFLRMLQNHLVQKL